MLNLKMLFFSVKFGELNTDADGKCDFKSNKQNAIVQLQELNENGKGKKYMLVFPSCNRYKIFFLPKCSPKGIYFIS